MKIYNITEKQEFIREVAELTQKEWGSKTNAQEEFENKVNNTIEKILSRMNDENYCKLVLVDNNVLIGFISIFPHDGEEKKELSPWYATMFVKSEYRGMGYSKLLNNAVLDEAKRRGFQKLYLKTKLENYYENFGAKFLEMLESGERLYFFEL